MRWFCKVPTVSQKLLKKSLKYVCYTSNSYENYFLMPFGFGTCCLMRFHLKVDKYEDILKCAPYYYSTSPFPHSVMLHPFSTMYQINHLFFSKGAITTNWKELNDAAKSRVEKYSQPSPNTLLTHLWQQLQPQIYSSRPSYRQFLWLPAWFVLWCARSTTGGPNIDSCVSLQFINERSKMNI